MAAEADGITDPARVDERLAKWSDAEAAIMEDAPWCRSSTSSAIR